MLDKAKVNYSRVSIVQESVLKERLEESNISRDRVTITAVDTVNMYPSIKLDTIRKLVTLFLSKLTTATKKTINICRELIHFGISLTLKSFDKDY